jgi:hypothetical protein
MDTYFNDNESSICSDQLVNNILKNYEGLQEFLLESESFGHQMINLNTLILVLRKKLNFENNTKHPYYKYIESTESNPLLKKVILEKNTFLLKNILMLTVYILKMISTELYDTPVLIIGEKIDVNNSITEYIQSIDNYLKY